MKSIVVLIGYMGSGKTSVGKRIALELKKEFIDLDAYIETQEKMTIPEIFSKKGEIYFRKKEYEYLKQLLQDSEKEFVLAVGGGTPCYGANMEIILNATQNVFYLKASIETLQERLIEEKEQRPLIAHLEKEEFSEYIRKHLFERNFYYLQAKHKINVDQKTEEEVTNEILSLL